MRFSADGSLLAEGVCQIALAADVVDLIAGGGILRLRRGHGHGHVTGLELHRGAIVVRDGIGDVVLPAEPARWPDPPIPWLCGCSCPWRGWQSPPAPQ